MDAGVNHLLTKLCDLQLGSHLKPTVAQPKRSRQAKKKILWNKSWNVLFSFLHGPHRKQITQTTNTSPLNEIEKLYALAYDLRKLRKFDEANNLEEKVQELIEDGLDDTKKRVLSLLISLSDVAKEDTSVVVGHGPMKLPMVFPRKGKVGVLPEGPLCHRDTCIQRKDDPYYTHFPSELFEVPGISVEQLGVTKYDLLDPSVFTIKPGSGLCGNGVFNVKGNLEDGYEKRVQCSLFGALTFSKTFTMDIVLDLPDIQDTWDSHILDLKPAKMNEVSEDEGFVDRTPSGSSLSSSCSSPRDRSKLEEEDERDIWDLALEHKPSRHYTWEHRGKPPRAWEKPYLTEAGAEAFNHLYHAYQRQLRLLDPNLGFPTVRTISMSTLVKNTLNMLIGVPSSSFQLREKTFFITEGTVVSGMSPEAVSSALADLIVCGSQYVRLVHFSKPPTLEWHHHGGLVFQAFTVGLRKYLQHYRACILSVAKTKSLLQLSALLEKLREQMRVLSSLCHSDHPPSADDAKKTFPTGVKLLTYLYDKTFEASSSLHYPMMLSLFHTSCGPYIMFVREWVFQGYCNDIYGEFMIQVNDDFLRFRDRNYWTRGYVLSSKNIEESVPPFLVDLANDIFVCGKSINLLRLIVPKHFLLALEAETPTVTLSFSEDDIRSIEQQCSTYKSRMQEVARQHTKAREDMIKEKEQAKQDILLKARKTAKEQIAKFQERAEAIKKAQDEKKRAAFTELKEHMEKDLRRRATEKEQEKEEDAARVAATNRQEVLEAAVEEDLAKKAREELIKEYEIMTAEVAHREQRALWRVARHRLEHRRLEFLSEDESKWQAELAANPFVPELDDESLDEALKLVSGKEKTDKPDGSDIEDDADTGIIPKGQREISGTETDETNVETVPRDGTTSDVGSVVKPGADTTKTDPTSSLMEIGPVMYATKEPEQQLPQWAKDGVKTAMAPFGIEEPDQNKMPSWARTALETDGSSADNDTGGGDQKIKSSEAEGAHEPDQSNSANEDGKKRRFKMTTWAASRAKMSLSQDGGLVYQKPHVSQTTQADNVKSKSSVKFSLAMSATQQSETELETIPHKKTVGTAHVGMQSEEVVAPKGIRKSASMSATQESVQELIPITHKKSVDGQHVSQQSEQNINKKPLVKINMYRHASLESEPVKLRVVQRNMFGHPSQVSMISNYEIIKPVKVIPQPSVFDEVDFGNFLVKPRKKNVNDTDRPMIGMNRDRYATKESEYVDYDQIKIEKFKALNIHGHASDSTVQRLLYGENFGRVKISRDASVQDEHEDYEGEPWTEIELETYSTDFGILNDVPVVDLMHNVGSDAAFSSWGDYLMSARSDIKAYHYISLPSLTKRSVKGPLATQIQLVNQSLVNYFTAELEVDQHFIALRRFLLMEDGEFGQSLSDQLFEKLAQNPMPHEMLNPMYLNNVLSRALRSSIHGDTQYASLVSFALKYIPNLLNHHAPNALDCLELTYRVDWPVNIVVTEDALTKYCRVFSFMLQLKRAVWVLKDVWHRLKRDALIHKASRSPQFERLHLCRHEMQHFVKVMQGYIANQIIHVTWQEFQEDLSQNVVSLDDLHRCHTDYLNKCVWRCLLSKEAGPVMNIIEDIFKQILKFRKQLISYDWRQDDQEGLVHPAYDSMCGDYKIFKNYARFLFKVVRKLAMRGYQPHLEELLLRLNFNSHYSSEFHTLQSL